MNMYSNTKKSKKFILILVLLMLFNFCCPKVVNAGIGLDDLVALPASIFFLFEKGIIYFMNNLFTDDDHHVETETVSEEYKAESMTLYLTPENIIKGKFIIFDANIFKEITDKDSDGDGKSDYFDYGIQAVKDGKVTLREVIAGWYYALRNLVIVALLSVLIYVGIRMIMSTIAQDKAKYKIMFKDWLVALCLVVVMHYMMIGILDITSLITDAMGDGQNSNMIGQMTEIITGCLSESYDDPDGTWFNSNAYSYPYTDPDTGEETLYTIGDCYAYILVIAGIIVYTLIFAVKYLKREFTIIFLILLGPVSCVTYPIDKISDGKAQAFNKWFSEFLYQVIIQPFHLLLYIVLIGSASALADKNVIYALVCFAVMIPAEKFVKEMFGFKDKLGSPLGAMATGAMAGKALSALMNKGKGSGGGVKKDEDENNSTPNQLPPRTVNEQGLIDGNLDGGRDNSLPEGDVRQQENPQIDSGEEERPPITSGEESEENLPSGEEPGGNASVSDAYQNSNNPVRDAEKAALEEKIADGQLNESELTNEQRELLGMSPKEDPYEHIKREALEEKIADGQLTEDELTEEQRRLLGMQEKDNGEQEISDEQEESSQPKVKDEQSEKSDQPEEDKQSEKGDQPEEDKQSKLQENNKPKNNQQSTWDKMKAIHNQRASKKYGTTDRKQRWKRRLVKGAKTGLKAAWKATKGATILGVGGLAVASALVTGNGKEALGIAAGLGTYAGKKVLSGGKKAIKGATGVIKDYNNGLKSDEKKEKKALKDFKADPNQIDKAVLSYREKHKVDPNSKQLDQEMNDRFALSRYGLKDEQIDKAVGSLQELRDEQGVPEQDALNQTVYAAKLAEDYSKKDFRSEKTMTEAVSAIANKFQEYGVTDRGLAEANAKKYLTQAAKIKGVEEIALPSTNQTVDIPIEQQHPNVPTRLGIDTATMSNTQLERMNRITVRLHNAGFSKGEVEQIAVSCSGGTTTEVLDKYEAKVEYLNDENAQEEAKILIESVNGGENATKVQVAEEMKERLILSSTFDIKDEKEITALRYVEQTDVKGKSQVQAAREFGIEHKGKLNDEAHMVKARESLVEKLKAGGSSREKAKKDADNIINLSRQYNNEVKPDKGATKQEKK